MFYTYVHRQRNAPDVIFYVGKGTRRRAWQGKRRGILWDRCVAAGGGFIAEIVEYWPTEDGAFKHERELIAEFRAQGISLVNLTDGGDGVPLIPEVIKRRTATLNETNRRPEVKHRRQVAMQLVFKNPEYKQRHAESMRAACLNPEILARKQAAIKRVRLDQRAQQRRLQSMRRAATDEAYREKKRQISLKNGNKPPIYFGPNHPGARTVICVEAGEQFSTVRLAIAWLVVRGFLKASASAIVACCRGRQKSAYQFHWKYAP